MAKAAGDFIVSGKTWKHEVIRKALHMLIALVPALSAVNRSHTALLLMAGTLFYASAESMRFLGFTTPLVSPLTKVAIREREEGHFALGPVTLGLGALLALILFPHRAAAAAVYALAFGDSAATLTGKFLGRIRPAFMAGKSVEGSAACFLVSAAAGLLVFGDWKAALAAGAASALAEALPLGDFDNLSLPLAVGVVLTL